MKGLVTPKSPRSDLLRQWVGRSTIHKVNWAIDDDNLVEEMELGLCMVVKNESERIDKCLENIIHLFDDIVIVDTGSSDNTVKLIQEKYKINPLEYLDPVDSFNIAEARNIALAKNLCSWVLILDADEEISCADLNLIKAKEEEPNINGYFVKWRNLKNDKLFDDYKMALFNKSSGIKYSGKVHAVPQHSLRNLGGTAKWLGEVTINHHHGNRRLPHRNAYVPRMLKDLEKNPDWFRYHWFIGYSYFQQLSYERAIFYLEQSSSSHSKIFPVECLNSYMVLIEIYAYVKGDHAKCCFLLESALSFYKSVESDFEVQINFKMHEWLLKARQSLENHRLEDIKAYDFAS